MDGFVWLDLLLFSVVCVFLWYMYRIVLVCQCVYAYMSGTHTQKFPLGSLGE
jgi:hypothetical protein